jgi:hypothetical protein
MSLQTGTSQHFSMDQSNEQDFEKAQESPTRNPYGGCDGTGGDWGFV